MALPLQDVGAVKVPQHVHSYLMAEAESSGVPMVSLVSKYIADAVEKKLHVVSLANAKHKSKGFGEILRDI